MGTVAGAVDPAIQRVMEEKIAVAAPSIGRTEPNAVWDGGGGIGPPSSGVGIGSYAHGDREVDVPSGIDGNPIGSAVGRQAILMVGSVGVGGDSPLVKVRGTMDAPGAVLGFGNGGGEGSGKKEENGEDDEKLGQCEPRPLVGGTGGLGFSGEVHIHRYKFCGPRLHGEAGKGGTGNEGYEHIG